MNPYLIIVTVILCLLIIAGSIYILVYFQHPEDKNVAWFPKIIVILGLSLSCFSILMLPLDVANTETPGPHGGFKNMDVLWLVLYIVVAAMVVIVIPFAIFYYEAEEAEVTEETPSQIGSAIKGTIITLIIFAIITVILYITIGIAEIPTVKLQSSLVTVSPPTAPEWFNSSLYANLTDVPPLDCFNVTTNITLPDNSTLLYSNETCVYPHKPDLPLTTLRDGKFLLKYRVTIILYIITMVVFFGWVLFVVFGGVGLAAFPFDCITSYIYRPIRIPLNVFTQKKAEIGEKATKLLEIGRAIQEKQKRARKKTRRDRSNYNKFRQSVFLLEEEYERVQECYKQQGGKIILYWFLLAIGVISVFLTILWLLHIVLYVMTQPYPIYPFLNDMVIAMDRAFGLFGTFAYGLFAFYLLVCVIKGNFKFGLRIFILFPIHPMRVRGTLMNAFLFNTLLILVCSVSITEFCTTAFSKYTSQTAINSMFSMSVRNLMGIKYIFIAYIYALFVMVCLSAIYLAIKPRERAAADKIVL